MIESMSSVAFGPQQLPQPALLVVDMQNDFVRVGAPLEVPEARETIPFQQALIRAFRDIKRPILFTRFVSLESENLLWNWSPQCRPDTRCCWRGHIRNFPDDGPLEGVAVIKELQPAAGEQVIDKHGYGAFHGTGLADQLHRLEVRSLVVTGTVTQICVEESARESFHHGFSTVIARDGVSSFDAELHNATLRNFAMKFGWVESTASIIRALIA